MIITLHGRRQLLDRTWCKPCLCVTFTFWHPGYIRDHKTGGGGDGTPSVSIFTTIIGSSYDVQLKEQKVKEAERASDGNYPHWAPVQLNQTGNIPSQDCKCADQAVIRENLDISLFALLLLSFDFPFCISPNISNLTAYYQTADIPSTCGVIIHPKNTVGNPFTHGSEHPPPWQADVQVPVQNPRGKWAHSSASW